VRPLPGLARPDASRAGTLFSKVWNRTASIARAFVLTSYVTTKEQACGPSPGMSSLGSLPKLLTPVSSDLTSGSLLTSSLTSTQTTERSTGRFIASAGMASEPPPESAAQPESRSADRAAAAVRDNEVVLRMPVMDVVCCLKDCPY
jgi:hypothetical protein